MENGIDTEYIDRAINELIELLGIKECVDIKTIIDTTHKDKIETCIKNVASYLGLPVDIHLSYVSSHYVFNSDANNTFESSAMVKTDYKGVGLESIIAQVLIPKNIPPYGSPALNNYPIKVKISQNCIYYPETLISVISHELSHILLASLLYKESDNEIYTDLVPIILGFSKIIESGREVTQTWTDGNTKYTNTTTYGYLNNEQLDFAITKVNRLLKIRSQKKKDLLTKIRFFNKKHKIYRKYSNLFNQTFNYFQRNKNPKIEKKDSSLIVSLYNPTLTNDMGIICRKSKERLEKLNNYILGLSHYTKRGLDILSQNTKNTSIFISDLDVKIKELKKNIKVLIKYLNFSKKITVLTKYIIIKLSFF